MSTKAHVEYSPRGGGPRIALVGPRDAGRCRAVRMWEQSPPYVVSEGGNEAAEPDGYSPWLQLTEEEARAFYEALADYYGHAGHDARALRKDYDAERARVDRLINNLIGGGR